MAVDFAPDLNKIREEYLKFVQEYHCLRDNVLWFQEIHKRSLERRQLVE